MDDETLRWAKERFNRPMLPLVSIRNGVVQCTACRRILGGDMDGKAKNVWWYCRDCKHGIYLPDNVG